ncbi:MAG: 5-deoxy-glucuronate isomerase, partial [Synergistaceae bacterium]|nr:5-deoxy-glucuronate isomerase [Synergistaceae bacterium]
MMTTNFKRNYVPKSGFTKVSKIGESSLKMLEFGIVELKNGEVCDFDTEETEAAFVILGGRCSVRSGGVAWENIGVRRTVFEGKATSFYFGRHTKVQISTDWNVKIAVVQSPVKEDTKPFLIPPENVRSVLLGQQPWERDTHFIFDGSTPTKRFCIGEAFVTPGNWAGFPPHKHDTDNMPAEGVLEEIYYFLFHPQTGFGIQYVYTKDGEFDVAYPVKSDDLVEMPKGYHTTVTAPGYNSYFLWLMAGDNKGF